MQVSFKERVKNIAIAESKNYKRNYVDYEYLVCSEAFQQSHYYIIDAKEDNYQHLIGVNALISAKDFFTKCIDGTLEEKDFNFIKRGQSEHAVIGSVRRKIKVLPNMMELFCNDIKVEENFVKNTVSCTFATSDNICTLGFINASKSRPMSLIKGNELNINNMKNVDLLLRKEIGKEKFDEIIIGNSKILMNYYKNIMEYLDEGLIYSKINNKIEECENLINKETASELYKQAMVKVTEDNIECKSNGGQAVEKQKTDLQKSNKF